MSSPWSSQLLTTTMQNIHLLPLLCCRVTCVAGCACVYMRHLTVLQIIMETIDPVQPFDVYTSVVAPSDVIEMCMEPYKIASENVCLCVQIMSIFIIGIITFIKVDTMHHFACYVPFMELFFNHLYIDVISQHHNVPVVCIHACTSICVWFSTLPHRWSCTQSLICIMSNLW